MDKIWSQHLCLLRDFRGNISWGSPFSVTLNMFYYIMFYCPETIPFNPNISEQSYKWDCEIKKYKLTQAGQVNYVDKLNTLKLGSLDLAVTSFLGALFTEHNLCAV